MCISSKTTIGGLEVVLHLGSWGNSLRVGDVTYTTDECVQFRLIDFGIPLPGPDALHKALVPYTKEQIISMLASLVDDAMSEGDEMSVEDCAAGIQRMEAASCKLLESESEVVEWEYEVCPISDDLALSWGRLGIWLNERGKDGWELIQVRSITNSLFWAIFKRRRDA